MSAASTYVDRARAFVSANRTASAVGITVVVLAVIGAVLIGLAIPLALVLAGIVVAAAFATMRMHNRRRDGGADSGATGAVGETGLGRSGLGAGVVVAHFALVSVVMFGVIQLVPYGRDHSNPSVIGEPAWSSPRTRELMVNACYGCHSNEVEWPWYSNIAPISWAITDHVNKGRSKVNYSEFTTSAEDADETVEEVLDGSMPPGYFTSFGLHPEANLSDAEIDELVAGLRATPGMSEDG